MPLTCNCGRPLDGSHDHNSCGPPIHSDDCECEECYEKHGDPDADCHACGGEGMVWGSDLSDPLWYSPDEIYDCRCCGGSGLAKDCTYW